MPTAKQLLLSFLIISLSFSACQESSQQDQVQTPANTSLNLAPVDLVEPLVDAANSRWFFFNSATRPFGMVNLSPDMHIDGAWNSGYRYNQDSIRCFSHIHAWQLSGIPVLPTTGEFKGHRGADIYASSYSHEEEEVRAGYHQIFLKDYGIDAELTSSKRVGFHRYTFPKSEESHIHIDFSTFLGPSDTEKGYARKVSDTEIEGYALMAATRRRPKATYVYFVAQFDKAFDQFGAWKDGKLLSEVDAIEGAKTGAYVSFNTEEGEKRLMKVGISYVSESQARKNLEKELSHWDFDRCVAESREEWNSYLSKIKIKGGTEIEQRRFYTDLWHALQGRRIISDVDGQYTDMTGPKKRTGQIPLDEAGKPRFNHYNSDSFWGAQWTLNTLWHLVYPKLSEEFVNSLLLMYKDGGLIPRGPSGGNYTFVMTGASTTPFIVSAYMKGIRGYDTELAYEGMKKNHLPGGLMSKSGYEHESFTGGGIEYYLEKGYVPYPLPTPKKGFHEDGAGQTLEYAYQDWALSEMAAALGKEKDAKEFAKRSQNFENLYKRTIGWMWVRDINGRWKDPNDFLQYDEGWIEGNAAQFSWFVPHDIERLIRFMGGSTFFAKKLNGSFLKASKHDFVQQKSDDPEQERKNRRIYINYGNQPSMQTAFLFNYSNTPWMTQYWSREVIDKVYSGISPQKGYSGDEDQGLMGSLAVIMKMGIFSMRGGTARKPIYEIGSPIFEEISIELDPEYYPGGSFIIEAKNNSPSNRYIQSASLNGEDLPKAWFYHQELVKGGKLILEMGPESKTSWASQVEHLPPSIRDSK
ncbi:MAG: GH92 family glycosyl hydrolase [Bacteroidota bacterium]